MILGKKEVLQNLEKLSQLDIYDATKEAIQFVRSQAVSNVPVDSGELQQSIYAEADNTEGGAIGTCFTNKKYAPYVELGTGPVGQENHSGISPNVSVSYTQHPWWIHEGPGENEVDRATAEKYRWFYIDTPQGRFYQCSGQAAQPFMYPALANHTDEIEEIYAKKIREVMK